ncbi:NAD(P)H-hydrate dehydratase [Lacticaseibacillus camelliae]|uniref:NAD(P)H-hydrate dehydratase n=1 Tax=Lacticaseibacillus camelliae TaxID=381742 RepID=UPI0006D14E7D|nr:NAD(P)H-hydrate dehydratase [Lacticaseibacillus camelliae]
MKKISASLINRVIQPRPQESHKGTFGRVLVIGGNAQFGGAAIMAASAAVYCGAGLVSVATAPVNRSALHARLPEAMIIPYDDPQLMALIRTVDVVAIGPGLGTDELAASILSHTLKTVKDSQALIIDGSAITLIAEHQLTVSHARTVWTPHQMEWQRLSGIAVRDQTPLANQTAATKLPGTVIVKSHRTELFTPTASYENPVGTPAMATGGMGDTLVGMLAGFIAQFGLSDDVVSAAVYAHSAIAEELAKTNYVVLPSMLIQQLPNYMQRAAAAQV